MLPLLQAGDLVDIIAPSYAAQNLEVLQKLGALLAKHNLNARIAKDIVTVDALNGLSDEIRAEHLLDAIHAEDSKAIWPIRGGYGMSRLIPFLEASEPPKHEKLLIGFSDVTALHIFCNQRWGWQSLHAPVAHQLVTEKVTDECRDEVLSVILGNEKTASFTLMPMNIAADIELSIVAPIVGGNLAVICAGIGTSWHVETEGKILFLEDTDEPAYRIDSMLTQIEQAGIANKSNAIIIGDFTETVDKYGNDESDLVITRFAQNCKVPVLRIQGVGHSMINRPLPLGHEVGLHLGEVPKLECHYS